MFREIWFSGNISESSVKICNFAAKAIELMENLHDFVYSEGVLDFVKKSNRFIELLSSGEPLERKEFISSLLRLMPGMYYAMLEIPRTEPVFDDENEKYVTEEEWSAVYQYVAATLSSQNEYLDIPTEDEYDRMELISRYLSEDLADIYQDIRDFLELYRNGNEEIMNDALWECRMNFESYWGEKMLRATLALHQIFVRDADVLEQMDREWEEKHGREINTDEWIISRRQKDFGGESGFQE